MEFLIGMAYGKGDDQIDKNPSWIESECYAIEARAPGEGSLSNDQLRLMLQGLLAQRFGLTVHRETKELSGYTLIVGKDGPKLTPTKSGRGTGHITSEGIQAQNISMTSLVTMLRRPAGAHVIDKTGLIGRYDINLSFALDMPGGPTDSSLPSVFTALQEQLGLKLVPGKIPVEMLVIDHVERTPTED